MRLELTGCGEKLRTGDGGWAGLGVGLGGEGLTAQGLGERRKLQTV
jgi:hypothetical protein